MHWKKLGKKALQVSRMSMATLAVTQFSLFGPLTNSAQAAPPHKTASPIKHVIVIVGENRTFDHIFATYKPTSGASVDNLLSSGIVNEDGTPGPQFLLAAQYSADVPAGGTFELAPKKKSLYEHLPAPLNGGPQDPCASNGICSLADAISSENGLDPNYYTFLTSGGTGLSGKVPDTRIEGVNVTAPYSTLPPGPFQLTDDKQPNPFTNDSYAASPVHRFYQMWQQEDCDAKRATNRNPSGCLADLFTWTGSNCGFEQQRKSTASKFQHGLRTGPEDDRRGRNRYGLLQYCAG